MSKVHNVQHSPASFRDPSTTKHFVSLIRCAIVKCVCLCLFNKFSDLILLDVTGAFYGSSNKTRDRVPGYDPTGVYT
jgi:hypothetical protein